MDDSFKIYVTKQKGKFVFNGRNFCNSEKGLNGEETALRIKNYFSTYKITENIIKENFYSELTKILGRYKAKKELENLL